jgi:hypothetical protein
MHVNIPNTALERYNEIKGTVVSGDILFKWPFAKRLFKCSLSGTVWFVGAAYLLVKSMKRPMVYKKGPERHSRTTFLVKSQT